MIKYFDAHQGLLNGLGNKHITLLLLLVMAGGATACSHNNSSLSSPIQLLGQSPKQAKNEGAITDMTLSERFSGRHAELERDSREGIVFYGKRYWPHFDIGKLPPSPIKGLPPVFQPGEYYILGDCGPEVEGLCIKIYKDKDGEFKLEVIDSFSGTIEPFKIDQDARKIVVDGKEIPLEGIITLSGGLTIEIVSYVYPHVAIIARNQMGEPWGQFFKKAPQK